MHPTTSNFGSTKLDTSWNTILWGQFGAAIDMLENAIMACPDGLWSDPSTPGVAGFWYVAYHTLFYLDLSTVRRSNGAGGAKSSTVP